MKDQSQNKKKRNIKNKSSEEQIIDQAIYLHEQGNISEAFKYYKYCINKGLSDPRIFSNYALILKNIGKLKEAELFTRKAIELNPRFVNAYVNLGNILQHTGRLEEAETSSLKAIELKWDCPVAHYNLGLISKALGKSEQSEISYRKAIELNPYFASAYCNLGGLLKDIGNLKEAESLLLKAIEIDKNLSEPYFILSTLNYSEKTKNWRSYLFSKTILNKKKQSDLVNIYFARSNVMHKQKQFKESEKFLIQANEVKIKIFPSDLEIRSKQHRQILAEFGKYNIQEKKTSLNKQNIFILGMPRSGTTLIESIISMNTKVDTLGEVNIFEESFLKWKANLKKNIKSNLDEIYSKKISEKYPFSKINSNKWLYNYQYVGIIESHIINSKIIYCNRNPLDNILSIYRANFSSGNHYATSLIDCAKIYLEHEKIINEYKTRFGSKIYDLNYDFLVNNPDKEIKSLISWLGWEWQEYYLSPHLNCRLVSTASSVQVRSPINSKSVGGWKNYKEMLQPAIKILSETDRYQELGSEII